jgi:hypothetical protein
MTQSFSLKQKAIAYSVAWIVALIATNPTGSLWPLIYMFPMGLWQIFYRPSLRDGGWSVLIVGFAVYVLHAFFYFRSRTRRSTMIWFAILVLLLLCNVSGCREMINTH